MGGRWPYSWCLVGCCRQDLFKRLEKKLDGNYKGMLRAILNKSWRQHPTRHQLYGHLPPTTKTIQVRRTRHAGHCWRSRDELISDVLLWTPTYGRYDCYLEETAFHYANKPIDGQAQCLTWSWTRVSCGLTLRIVSSIGELLLLICEWLLWMRIKTTIER